MPASRGRHSTEVGKHGSASCRPKPYGGVLQGAGRDCPEPLCDLAQYDSDMADRIKAIWASRKTALVDEADVLQTQIEKAQAQIAHLDHLLTKPARPLTEQTEARYIAQLGEAETALEGCWQSRRRTASGKTRSAWYLTFTMCSPPAHGVQKAGQRAAEENDTEGGKGDQAEHRVPASFPPAY